MRLLRAIHIFFFVLFSKDKYEVKKNSISDGYHTFDELYEHRMIYNAAFAKLCTKHNIKVETSTRHSDGNLCFGGGWFIINILLPTGKLISNHYKTSNYHLFVKLPYSSTSKIKYDGHTTKDCLIRLEEYIKSDL